MKPMLGITFRHCASAVLALFLSGSFCLAQEKINTVQAMAHGQGNQAGMTIGLTITLESYSTAEDRTVLWEAFDKGGEEALVKALVTAPVRGHLAFSGVGDYDIVFVRALPTANGSKLRVLAIRRLPPGQVRRYKNVDYLVSAVELDLIAGGKSAGVFIPACDLSMNKSKEVEIVTYQSAWPLDGVVVTSR